MIFFKFNIVDFEKKLLIRCKNDEVGFLLSYDKSHLKGVEWIEDKTIKPKF